MQRFGDYFDVTSSIATLLNEVFVINEDAISMYDIEDEIIRPANSPKGCSNNKKEYIIFPYYYNDGLCHFTEEAFENKFPNTIYYLRKHKELLLKRKSDLKSQWFEYGRSQALLNLNCEKILMSTIFTNEARVYILEENNVPYSGIIIRARVERGATLEDARRILMSRNFKEYVERIGIGISGQSTRITSMDIKNYYFKGEQLDVNA